MPSNAKLAAQLADVNATVDITSGSASGIYSWTAEIRFAGGNKVYAFGHTLRGLRREIQRKLRPAKLRKLAHEQTTALNTQPKS